MPDGAGDRRMMLYRGGENDDAIAEEKLPFMRSLFTMMLYPCALSNRRPLLFSAG